MGEAGPKSPGKEEVNQEPIFLRTGDELTVEEKLKLSQLTVEALAHLAKAEALLEQMQKRREKWINMELHKRIF